MWYGRTVIRSCYKMTYEAAQAVIDGERKPIELKFEVPEWAMLTEEAELRSKYEALRANLLLLTRVAKSIQDQRETEGALR